MPLIYAAGPLPILTLCCLHHHHSEPLMTTAEFINEVCEKATDWLSGGHIV